MASFVRKNGLSDVDKLVWFLTVLQFSLISILEMSSFGSVFLAITSVFIFLLAAFQDRGRIRVKLDAFHLFVLVFAFFCFASGIWAWNAGYAFEKGLTILELFVCFSMVYYYYRKKQSVDLLISAVMWGCFAVMGYSILALGWSNVLVAVQNEARLAAGFTNTNSLSLIIALAFILSVYRIQTRGIKLWNLLLIPAVVLIAALGSRKALILVVLGVSLLYLTNDVGSKKQIWLKILRAILVIVIIFLVLRLIAVSSLFSGLNNRMQGFYALITGEGQVDHSSWVRQQMIELGWKQFLRTPIIGIGMGNARIMTGILGYDSYLHNNYIELLADGGVIGFFLYYGMYIYLVHRLIKYGRRDDPEAKLCLVLIACLLVADYGVVSYYTKSTYYFLMVFFLKAFQVMKERYDTRRIS